MKKEISVFEFSRKNIAYKPTKFQLFVEYEKGLKKKFVSDFFNSR